jgi:hypothetical protein
VVNVPHFTKDADDVLNRSFEALRPPPIETLQQWIECTISLPVGLAAEPGTVTLWPTQRAVAVCGR